MPETSNTHAQGANDVIDISDIHMIKVVTEVGSINKAAEILSVSQPTLSKKISRLEKKVGVELFNRDSVGMMPTEAAKFLIKEGNGLRAQLQVIERQLELMSDMVGGTVRVGVGPIIEQQLLAKVLLDFAERDYQFKISVVTMSADALLDQLKKSKIDLAVGPFVDSDVPDDIVAPLKTSEKLVVAVRQGHDAVARQVVDLQAISNYKIITPNIPASLGGQVMVYLENAELEPDIICESYTMAKYIVMNSDYVTAGPESLFLNEFKSGELVKLEFPYDVYWQSQCLVKPETLLMPIVKRSWICLLSIWRRSNQQKEKPRV
ncbi:LysR family transcriptional regulator [Endozoicomonas sp. GU-1]|uniref:LysR family transcriptional regulator n=1 Tax=Endozoicomonas sp. GU-1 TaxID=3009078 RepID=UPI0022B54408|nr:LysR family transcriptional regulator [Endozoicomonas sp. GU-1]WBA84235.1 LysR family transcriptional regulator [Endozoicomonas sp. GU-1]